MTTRAEEILNHAMSLGADERLDIVERLLETLEPDGDVVSDAEWAAELRRRSEELARDPSAGIPWEELRDEE